MEEGEFKLTFRVLLTTPTDIGCWFSHIELDHQQETDGKTESFRYPLGLTLCALGDTAKVCTADEARAGHL